MADGGIIARIGTEAATDEAPDLFGRTLAEARRAIQAGERPRLGRPPGSKNRRTILVEKLVELHGDPLEVLLMMANMGVYELAAALGCTRLEAWREKRAAAEATLRYVHSPKPVTVEGGKGIIPIVFDLSGSVAPGAPGDDAIPLGQAVPATVIDQ